MQFSSNMSSKLQPPAVNYLTAQLLNCAHRSQTHSQQLTLTQHNMLPQHPVNIMELFCECF